MFRFLRSHLSLSDFVLIIVVLLAIVVSASAFLKKDSNKYVYIYKDNTNFGVYPLYRDKVITIDEHNTVEIKAGKVRMLYADCPDRRCVKQGAGNVLPIICLPNHVVVEIRSKDDQRVLIVR